MEESVKDFIPYDKCSKKERRKRDKERRNTWEIPPYTKIVPDKKKNRRGKKERDNYYEDSYYEE